MTAYVVSSGQTSSGVTLNSGDTLTVLSGGAANSTTINSGGSQTVIGTASTTTGYGRDDIVGFGRDGVWVSLSNGDGSFAQPKLVLSSFAVDAGGWTTQDRYPRLVADVTGDGKADIIGFGQDGVWVSQATGSGTFAAPTFDSGSFGASAAAGGWTSENSYPRLSADVNGKHAANIVGFGISGVYTAIPVGFT